MPIADPISGRIFIWIIATFLFLSIAVGGSFLILYIALPHHKAQPWLPVVGVILVCLPWIFWFLTCFYRLVSRALGFRVVIGGGGGGAAPRSQSNVFTPTENGASEEVTGGDEKNDNGGHEMNGANKSNSSNDICIASHESEMPLTSAMAC